MGLFDANMSTTSSTNVSQLPDWYMNAQKGVAQAGLNVANRGYSPYPGARIAAPSGDTTAAYGLTRSNVGNWAPLLNQSGGAIDQALGKSAYGAASPYLSQASQTVPGVIDSYMSPYTSSVVDRIGELGARNLTENILPGINQTFVGGGSFGGKRNSEFVNRAIRDTQEATAAEQAKALESGYATAGNLAQQDLSRLGQLGQTAGNLTTADVTALLQGAQQRAANASQMQGQGLKDAAALQSIGQQQEAQAQKSLDLGYQDFLNQRDWDKGNVEWLSGVLGGQRLPTSSTSTTSTPTASDGQQLIGTLTTLAGLPWDQIGSWLGFKKGGLVKKYARGGMVDSFPQDTTLDALPLGDGSFGVPSDGRMEGDFGPLDDEQLKRLLASPDPYLRQMAQKELLKRQSALTGGANVAELTGSAGDDDLADEETIDEDTAEEAPSAGPLSAPAVAPPGRPAPPAAAPAGPLSTLGNSDTMASMKGALEQFSAPSQSQTRARDAVRQALGKPQGSWADNPLLQAGLSIMSNRRPDLLGAVGEGIGAAAQASRGRADAERERMLKLASAELGFADKDSERALMALRALKPGAAKDTRTANQKDYEAAVAGGYKKSFPEYVKEMKAAGRTQVNVSNKEESEEAKAVGKSYGEMYVNTVKSGLAANQALAKLDRLDNLLDQVNTGKFAGGAQQVKAAAKSLGVDLGALGIKDDVAPAQAAEALANEMALELRSTADGGGMPGAMSDADRQFLRSMVPGIEKTAEGRRMVIETAKALKRRDIQIAQMARAYRAKNGQLDEGFYDELQKFSDANPLFAGSRGGGASDPLGIR